MKKTKAKGSGRGGIRAKAATAVKRTGRVRINAKRFIGFLCVLAFIIYFVIKLITQQITINRKNSEINSLNEQITTAEQETERLRSELESVNDPEYLERMAREKLGLVSPNERVYIDANSRD